MVRFSLKHLFALMTGYAVAIPLLCWLLGNAQTVAILWIGFILLDIVGSMLVAITQEDLEFGVTTTVWAPFWPLIVVVVLVFAMYHKEEEVFQWFGC